MQQKFLTGNWCQVLAFCNWPSLSPGVNDAARQEDPTPVKPSECNHRASPGLLGSGPRWWLTQVCDLGDSNLRGKKLKIHRYVHCWICLRVFPSSLTTSHLPCCKQGTLWAFPASQECAWYPYPDGFYLGCSRPSSISPALGCNALSHLLSFCKWTVRQFVSRCEIYYHQYFFLHCQILCLMLFLFLSCSHCYNSSTSALLSTNQECQWGKGSCANTHTHFIATQSQETIVYSCY